MPRCTANAWLWSNRHEGKSVEMLPWVRVRRRSFLGWCLSGHFYLHWSIRPRQCQSGGRARNFFLHGSESRSDFSGPGHLLFLARAEMHLCSPGTCVWHHVLPFWVPRGHCERSALIEPAQRGQCCNVAPGWGSSMAFFWPAAFGDFLCPQKSRAKLMSIWGAAHAISAFTKVNHVVILSIRAVGLVCKLGAKSTPIDLCTCIWHRAWPF